MANPQRQPAEARGCFTGRFAVVTGSAQGLGAATAGLLAEQGAAGLMLCDVNQDMGERTADVIASSCQCNVRFTSADLSAVDDCYRVIAEAESAFGELHSLVNCAGRTDRGTLVDTSPELFDALFAVNIRAPFFLMQATARLMKRTRTPGTMVNISSMSSYGGQPFLSAYCASKGALITLTRNAAFSLACDRIRVNAINVGWMETPSERAVQLANHGAGEDWPSGVAPLLPFGRLVQPNEVARLIVYLSSDQSGLMTGAVVDFDQSIRGAYDSPPLPRRG